MSRSLRQHLADLSGNSVRDFNYSKFAAHFGKDVKVRDARDLRNEMERERVTALDEPHIDMMRRVIEQALEKESAELNGSLPVISIFEASQMAKDAVKRASRDVGLQNLSTHLERRWKADKEAHLSASDILTLRDHYNRNFPKSAASGIVDGFTKSGYLDLPVGHLMDIAGQIRNQNDFDYYIKEAGLHTNNPYNKKARNFILAMLNGKIAEDEDEWEGDEDELNPTIILDNMDDDKGMVSAYIQGPGAAEFAEQDQTIMGTHWETDGPDFAVAVISDDPNLLQMLEADGYKVDDSQYYQMSEQEWKRLNKKWQGYEDPELPDYESYSDYKDAEWLRVKSKRLRRAQEDDELNPTIILDNMDRDDGMVTVHMSGPGVAEFAENEGGIADSNWESDGPDFAYAVITDEPGLVQTLEAEGYKVDDSQYYEMDESEWEELAQKDEQRRFDEKQMKLPGIQSKRARRVARSISKAVRG